LLSYAALIFFWSSQPLPEGGPLAKIPFGDKLAHGIEYLIFGLLALKAFVPKNKKGIVVMLLISLGYAISDEVHQIFVPTRIPSFFDWLADSMGIFGSLLLRYKFPERFKT